MLRTKAQRERLCQDCPLARAADVIGDTCCLIIVRDLLEKPRRYSELQVSLSGVSSRTLALKLKALEQQGFITRLPTGTTHAQYALTKKGRCLRPVIAALRRFGEAYL